MSWKAVIAGALIVVAGGLAVGLAIGGKETTRETTVTTTVTKTASGSPRTTTAPAATGTPTEGGDDRPGNPSGAIDTIVDLEESDDVAPTLSSFDGDFGQQSIGGESFDDGVSMLVYPDQSSGVPELTVDTKGRYAKLSGVVGIDGDAECFRNAARVSITDASDRILWGPEKVNVDSRRRFDVDISGAVKVNFVQRSLGSEDTDCESANPAWGAVKLVSR